MSEPVFFKPLDSAMLLASFLITVAELATIFKPIFLLKVKLSFLSLSVSSLIPVILAAIV